MGFQILLPPASGSGGGPVAWSDVTGKPSIATGIGDPGSDDNLASEQAIREEFDKFVPVGVSVQAGAPGNVEFVVTDASPIAGTLVAVYGRTLSGTITAEVKLNGTPVVGDAIELIAIPDLTDPPTEFELNDDNTLAVGDIITIEFSEDASAEGVSLTILINRNK